MAVPEQFSLRWNDFYSNLAQSFQTFLAGKDLVDVTLAVEGQYVHAHKLILSVCSPYFKELFKMNPCEHPIVFLKDVTYHELHQLIQFMYRGEVHVRQQELSGFLHTAEMLQVKGLTSSRDRSESPPPVLEEPPVESKMQIHQPIELSNDSQPEWIEDAAVEPPVELPPVIKEETPRSPLKRLLKVTPNKNSYMKKKHRASNENAAMPEKVEYGAGAGGYDDEPLIDFDNDLQMIHHHSVLVLPKSPKEPAAWLSKTGGVKCPSCHRIFANRYNLKVHIRDKHDTREGTLQCEICNKRMRNPSCLRVHMYHHRKQAAYMAQMNAPSEFGRLMQGVVGVKHEWRSDGQTAQTEHTHNDKMQGVVGVKHEWRSDGQTAPTEHTHNDKGAQGATGVKTGGQVAAAGFKENDVGEAASPQQAAGEEAAPAHV